MIGHDEDGPVSRNSRDIFQSVDLHQVVGCQMDPTRAENTLAPGPETLPTTLVHATNEAKGEPFE